MRFKVLRPLPQLLQWHTFSPREHTIKCWVAAFCKMRSDERVAQKANPQIFVRWYEISTITVPKLARCLGICKLYKTQRPSVAKRFLQHRRDWHGEQLTVKITRG